MSSPSRKRAFGIALVLAVVMLLATRQVGGGYALHGNYRAQVDALLDGRLALTPFVDGMAHDLAWTDGGVQQVWGLGVPLWQAPFEVIGRIVGVQPFPDRVALAIWIALAGYALIRGFRPRMGEPWFVAAGTIGIVFLLPGFVAMMRGRVGVYEEAAAYSYAAALILLGGLASFVRAPTSPRLIGLFAVAGAGGLIRPTVWFYGVATAAIAGAIWMRVRGKRGLPALAVGAALFLAGGVALYATNAARFGAGGEFGHRLNVHSLPGNIVATRFSYPFERVGIVDAAVELGGSLFDRPEQARVKGFYEKELHVGQSEAPRWREYYFSTYSWAYLPVILAGLFFGARAWRRKDRDQHILWTWAIVGAAPLVVFYLRSPSVSSRYQLDLGPAIAVLIVIAWRQLARALADRRAIAIGILTVAWTLAIVTSRVHRPNVGGGAIGRAEAAANAYAASRPTPLPHVLPSGYDLADPFVVSYTDVAPDFTRCTDELGATIDCAIAPLAGDHRISGARHGRWWEIDVEEVVEFDPGACFVDEDRCEVDTFVEPLDGTVVTTGPYLNGSGWDLETGNVPPATFFYATDPRFVELDVDGPGDLAAMFRVAIDRDHLALVGAADLPHGARLRFALPLGSTKSGLHVIFVAAGPDAALDRTRSDYAIRAIVWK